MKRPALPKLHAAGWIFGGHRQENPFSVPSRAFTLIELVVVMTAPIPRQDRGNRFLALIAGVILITCAGCQSDTYTHSQFHERSARLTTVAFLPPCIRTGMASNLWVIPLGAPLSEETRIRAELPCLVADGFRKRGLTVKKYASGKMLPDSTNQMWNAHMQGLLSAAYGNLGLKAVRPEAKVLADHVQADGLVFLSVFAYKSTEGRKAKVAAENFFAILGAYGGSHLTPCSQAIVQIALVDGETGDVLWRTTHDFTDLEKTRPDQVIAELFKKYPKR
jgi:hypothetical protein